METKTFKQVFIHSEADLPKEGIFIVKDKSNANPHYFEINDSEILRCFWLKNIDWYLIEQPDPGKTEEILRKACGYSDSDELYPSDDITVQEALEAIHDFARQNMREELIRFLKEYHKSMFVIDLENSKIDYEAVVDDYLKSL